MIFKFLIFVILFILFIGVFFGFSIFRLIFGSSSRNGKSAQNTRSEQRGSQSTAKTKSSQKIISKDEGEYIDFEEIKD